LGACAEHSGSPLLAADFYSRSIESAPGYAKPRTNLAFIRLREGRMDAAQSLLDGSLRLYDGDPETWLGLALCSALAGDQQASTTSLSKAEALGGVDEYGRKFRQMLDELTPR
ncbi:MAG: hypothetical protein WCL44_05830, partial [bacterium]